MLTIESAIKKLLSEPSAEEIFVLKPSSFRFWKTYDGLELNAQRVITDIFYEIETIKQKSDCVVTKLSIIGYSLGGLISRYLIGELEAIGFFENVKPVFFTTFSTPHVGIEFFKDNFFDRLANFLGKYLFGESGRQIFLADSEKIMVKMVDPNERYYKGLRRFEKHILLSNVKNDRTVAFFTSFITEYSPFEEWSRIKIKYLKDLPLSRIGEFHVRPKFVDLRRTSKVNFESEDRFKGNVQEVTSVFRSNFFLRYLIIILASFILIPFWIPTVLFTSVCASVYSIIKLRIIKPPKIAEHWKRVKDSVYGAEPIDSKDAEMGIKNRQQRENMEKYDTFKGDTSGLTENAMERFMFVEEALSNRQPELDMNTGGMDNENADENADESNSFNDSHTLLDVKHDTRSGICDEIADIDFKANDECIKEYIAPLSNYDPSEYPLFNQSTRLKISQEKKKIIDSLNSLDWIKISVYIDAWNAHDGIVARRGPRTNPKGASTIYLWLSILRNHLAEDS